MPPFRLTHSDTRALGLSFNCRTRTTHTLVSHVCVRPRAWRFDLMPKTLRGRSPRALTRAWEMNGRTRQVFKLTLAQRVVDVALFLWSGRQPRSSTPIGQRAAQEGEAAVGKAAAGHVEEEAGLVWLLEREAAAAETLLTHLCGCDCVRLAASCRAARDMVSGSRAAAQRVRRCLAETVLGEHAWAFDAFFMVDWRPQDDSSREVYRQARQPPKARFDALKQQYVAAPIA